MMFFCNFTARHYTLIMKYPKRKELTDFFLLKKEGWMIFICLGLLLKMGMLPIKTGDYNLYLEPWLNFIKTHGYTSSLKFDFYNYTPSYIYILITLAKIGLNPLYSIKIVSIVFEYVLAYYVGRIAYLKYKDNLVLWIAFAVIPLLPTVLLNSSYLSQCDSIYAAFVVGSIYFILKKEQFLSLLFLGIAFAFKMQAILLLPFYFVLLLRRNIRWYYFLLIPVVFILSITPAWIFGRSFTELLNIYLLQAEQFRYLTLNFPNIYCWISNDFYEPIRIAGVGLTVLLTLYSGWWLSKKRFSFTYENWIKLAFLSAIIVPFILPGMHERYMYLGDVLGVLYYLVLRRNIHLPLGVLLVSTYSYIRCSRYNDMLPMEPAFFIYFLVILFTSIDFVTGLKQETNDI